jgi:hypothetical protein
MIRALGATLAFLVVYAAAAGAPERIHVTTATRARLELFVRIPLDAVFIRVVVGCEHGTKETDRELIGGGQAHFIFRDLHAEEHVIGAAVVRADGSTDRLYRTVFIRH